MRTIAVVPVPEFPKTSRARVPRAGRPDEVRTEAAHESRLRAVLRWRRRGGAAEPDAAEVATPRRESPFPFC